LSSDVLTDTIVFMKTQTTPTNPSRTTPEEELSGPSVSREAKKSEVRVDALKPEQKEALTANKLNLGEATQPDRDQMAAQSKAFGEMIAGGGNRSLPPGMHAALRELRKKAE
jgi:hypothetical protein